MDPESGQVIEVMSSGPTVYRTTRPTSSSGPGSGKRGPKKRPLKELPCEYCKKVFNKDVLLQGHIDRMHSSSSKKKTCPQCNKTLKSSQSLRDHRYYYHTPKTCELCNEDFPGAYQYYYHRNKEHAAAVFCDSYIIYLDSVAICDRYKKIWKRP